MDNATAPLSRRNFLVVSAAAMGGLALGLVPSACTASQDASASAELTPWVVIGADDSVTLRLPCPEFGTGAMTQQALCIAEELACDWSKIRYEIASANRDYVTRGVYSPVPVVIAFFGGRSTIGMRIAALQQIGASARERLKAAAAKRWDVPASEIAAEKSVLTHRPTGRSLRYAEVAAEAASIKLAAEPAIKTEEQWTLLGKASPGKLTTPDIVKGALTYGIDVRVPGMVYAALMQAPVHGGRLRSYDARAVEKMPGVLAVVTVDPDEPRGMAMLSSAPYGYALTAPRAAVAVIAEHYWQARKALEALPVEWDDGPGKAWASTDQIYTALHQSLEREDDARVEAASGDVSGIKTEKTVVEQSYLTPWCDQAPLEPLNGTALVTADTVEVWHPAQHSQQGFWVASDEAGMLPERVIFHQTHVGGAFGRRLESDDVRMVVAVAKRFPGRPVHVIWSREEMMRQGKYRPVVAAKLTAALDGRTKLPKAMIVRQASRGHYPRLADVPYFMGAIPNIRVDARELPLHVTPGPYRGPGYNSYAFIVETFIDECAVAAGMDPLDYRLKLLDGWPNPGWVQCLREVAQKSGWGKSLPRGMGQGIAISAWGLNGNKMGGTCVAVVATVEVSARGDLKVHQLDAAFDCGRVMNRDFAENMLQGGLIFGLNMALNEEMTVADGRMVEGNFDTYPVLRMADAPAVKVHFGGLSGAGRYGELGEPPVGPVGPAVGNAIFRATGIRLRRQPFRTQDLRWS